MAEISVRRVLSCPSGDVCGLVPHKVSSVDGAVFSCDPSKWTAFSFGNRSFTIALGGGFSVVSRMILLFS